MPPPGNQVPWVVQQPRWVSPSAKRVARARQGWRDLLEAAMVPFDNVLTAIWGLVAFGGFVSTLLLTKAEDYRQRLRFSHQHSRSVFRPDASALVTGEAE